MARGTCAVPSKLVLVTTFVLIAICNAVYFNHSQKSIVGILKFNHTKTGQSARRMMAYSIAIRRHKVNKISDVLIVLANYYCHTLNLNLYNWSCLVCMCVTQNFSTRHVFTSTIHHSPTTRNENAEIRGNMWNMRTGRSRRVFSYRKDKRKTTPAHTRRAHTFTHAQTHITRS